MRRRLVVLVATAAIATGLTGPSFSAAAAPAPVWPDATGFQGNARHDGNTGGRALNPATMQRKWAVDLGTQVSYPVVASARVFVTVKTDGKSGTQLHALDLKTGKRSWGPVALGGQRPFGALATGGGRVYAMDYERTLRAFDARTGALRWSVVLPGQRLSQTPPVEYGGTVYAVAEGSGGTVYAVDGATGRIRWSYNGNEISGTPAVDASGVYFSAGGRRTVKFSHSGQRLWEFQIGIFGPNGLTPTLAGPRLFTRDSGTPGTVFDATTGAEGRRLPQYTGPYAISGSTALSLVSSGPTSAGGVLTAVDAATGSVRWRQAVDLKLKGNPVISGSTVYVGSISGWVFGLDVATGKLVWRGSAGAQVLAGDAVGAGVIPGSAAAGGYLLVAANHRLVAFG